MFDSECSLGLIKITVQELRRRKSVRQRELTSWRSVSTVTTGDLSKRKNTGKRFIPSNVLGSIKKQPVNTEHHSFSTIINLLIFLQ